MRKMRDSNPRYEKIVQRISSPPRSVTPAIFQKADAKIPVLIYLSKQYRKKIRLEAEKALNLIQ